jgi:hypothetical protein
MTTLIPKYDMKNGGSIPSGAVNRDIQSKLSDIVSVFDFMTPAQIADVQAGTLSVDCTTAIQNALNCTPVTANSYAPTKTTPGGGRVTIIFPQGRYLVSSVLDLTQRDYQYLVGEGRAEIVSSSTTYIIDVSSTDHCGIENIALTSYTATVGIYMNRLTTAPYTQFNSFINVAILMGSQTTVNAGNGTIAFYNNRGELNYWENCYFTADVSYWATQFPAAGILLPSTGTQDTSIISLSAGTLIGCQFTNNGSHNSTMVLVGMVGFKFLSCYWNQGVLNTGSSPYIVNAQGVTGCDFTGVVESCRSFMVMRGFSCYSLNIELSIAVQSMTANYSVIMCDDPSFGTGLNNSRLIIMIGAAAPVNAYVLYNAANAQSNGNIIQTPGNTVWNNGAGPAVGGPGNANWNTTYGVGSLEIKEINSSTLFGVAVTNSTMQMALTNAQETALISRGTPNNSGYEYTKVLSGRDLSSGVGSYASYLGFYTENKSAANNTDTSTEKFRVKALGACRFVPLASAPASAEAGDVYYDSGTNILYCYNGSSWNALF